MAEQTMVERVTLAMKADLKRQLAGQPLPGPPGDLTDWSAQGGSMDLGEIARAAIEALRMPTKAMIEAAYAPTDDLVLARFKWEAMLNAALAEGADAGEKAGITQAE